MTAAPQLPTPTNPARRKLQGLRPELGVARDLGWLALLWVSTAIVILVWLLLDRAPPAWDQGDHLTRALEYLRQLQQPNLSSSEWWRELWLLSPSYRAPLVYLMTAPILAIAGQGLDQATAVNLVFSALLITTTYGLGRFWGDRQTGLWAATLTALLPVFLIMQTDYLLDYGLVAVISLAILSLTCWRGSQAVVGRWFWSILAGISVGLVLLTKPTGLLFLLIPGLWLLGEQVVWRGLIRRDWQSALQFGLACGLVWLVCSPWYLTNWITILSSSDRSNATALLSGDDPPVGSLAAWLYYGRSLPILIPLPLLGLALGTTLLGLGEQIWRRKSGDRSTADPSRTGTGVWLLVFCLGAYGLSSLLANKDPRHVLPIVPVLLVFLARGLTLIQARWSSILRWLTVPLLIGLSSLALFPLPAGPWLPLRRLPYLGTPWPHADVIQTIIAQQPYLRSTLAVIPNSAEINAFNFNAYGALARFQVYGRDIGFIRSHALRDARSLTWYLTKTGDQGPDQSIITAQDNLRSLVEQSVDLAIAQTWDLPDGTTLRLHRRQPPAIVVAPSEKTRDRVELVAVNLPSAAAIGTAIPITYQLQGPWKALQDGLLLLTWNRVTANPPDGTPKIVQSVTSLPQLQPVSWIAQADLNPDLFWVHDHGIGLGQLYAGRDIAQPEQNFTMTENLAAQPPADLPPGVYRLTAAYVDRQTGKQYPLKTPTAQVRLDRELAALSAPEPDLITQFRQLAAALPAGQLDLVFREIGRINQYDPIQDYVLQAEAIFQARLQMEPDRLEWLYPLALTQVLQRKAEAAITTFSKITQLDSQNPWAWAYLGFVRLYRWQPRQADAALAQAAALDPKLSEVKTLQGVAALLQGNLLRAYRLLL